jgi:hypothetical protein
MITTHKRVDAAALLDALDKVDAILVSQPTEQKRRETLSYIIYRGYESMRKEAETIKRRVQRKHRHATETQVTVQ